MSTSYLPRSSFPPVVRALLIANGIAYLIQALQPGLLEWWLALWPLDAPEYARGYGAMPQFEIWQVVSYGFLHGGFTHLFFNMFALWMFGSAIEQAWGSKRFAQYYFVCVIGAALVQLAVVSTPAGGLPVPTVGASGGVFGLLLAFGMTYPNRVIMLLVPPIPMKAKYFVLIYGGLELLFGVSGPSDGIAHFAHLGGMAFGFALIQYWLYSGRARRDRH